MGLLYDLRSDQVLRGALYACVPRFLYRSGASVVCVEIAALF